MFIRCQTLGEALRIQKQIKHASVLLELIVQQHGAGTENYFCTMWYIYNKSCIHCFGGCGDGASTPLRVKEKLPKVGDAYPVLEAGRGRSVEGQ